MKEIYFYQPTYPIFFQAVTGNKQYFFHDLIYVHLLSPSGVSIGTNEIVRYFNNAVQRIFIIDFVMFRILANP